MALNPDLFTSLYKPDVLMCLADLSNDEVFTPPDVANQVLDMLPQELFRDPNTKFLDPALKSGVFLREIAKRLIAGLADKIPNLQDRCDHIFKNQLYGIAITELTSLLGRRSVYCSKYPNSPFSVTKFDDVQGNIVFHKIRHKWDHAGINGKCIFCRTSYDGDLGDLKREGLETHAYEFIHTLHPEEILNMKFDVICSNPPYQLGDGSGLGAGAIPIYQKFVEQAIKLNPRYITMIIPARWYGGGRGLDDFRANMISDKRIRILHDYVNAEDCFTGVEIKGGICYFLWDRDHAGKCSVVTHTGNKEIMQEERFLREENSDVFIRYAEGVSVYHKVRSKKEKTFEPLVSSQRPFGLRTYVHGDKKPSGNTVKLYERGGIGYIDRKEITKNNSWVDQPKVYISAAYNAGDKYPHQIIGKPIAGESGSACTETYVVVGPFSSEKEVANVMSYMQTKFFRFLVMLKKTSQHAASTVYSFVPVQDFSRPWTDEELYRKYELTPEEIAFIDSLIRPMDISGGDE